VTTSGSRLTTHRKMDDGPFDEAGHPEVEPRPVARLELRPCRRIPTPSSAPLIIRHFIGVRSCIVNTLAYYHHVIDRRMHEMMKLCISHRTVATTRLLAWEITRHCL
jgi:hypothetical protein